MFSFSLPCPRPCCYPVSDLSLVFMGLVYFCLAWFLAEEKGAGEQMDPRMQNISKTAPRRDGLPRAINRCGHAYRLPACGLASRQAESLRQVHLDPFEAQNGRGKGQTGKGDREEHRKEDGGAWECACQFCVPCDIWRALDLLFPLARRFLRTTEDVHVTRTHCRNN